jgi:predicted acetyltransferase
MTVDDADVSLRASRDAFGGPLQDRAAFTIGGGIHRWAIFDGPVLAAKANDREYSSLIGGRELCTAGVAGVLVTPEYRGTGLAREVMTHLFRTARERGAVLSTLFRTAPALYRSLGYEQVAELCLGELPTAALRGLRVRNPTTVRRATLQDVPAIKAVYARVASAGACLLTRTGPCFTTTDEKLIESFDGITVAVNPTGGISGYLSWKRGENWGPDGVLEVVELHGLDADSTESLLAVVGSFDAVTPMVRFRTSGLDPMHWLIPGAGWSVRDVKQYMLRVIDLAGAVEQRGWPESVAGAVEFSVLDGACPWNTGHHRLVLAGGRAVLEPGSGAAGMSITPRGLALLMAGDSTVAALRRAGLIEGGTAADSILDAAMAGPRPAILDFF